MATGGPFGPPVFLRIDFLQSCNKDYEKLKLS